MMRRFSLAAILSVWATAVSASSLEGRVTYVRDVDTIEVEGVAVRLQGLNGAERGEAGFREARRWMIELVGSERVSCDLTGEVSHDRLIGRCWLGGSDIAALAVAAGHGRDCARFSGGRYAHLETPAGRQIPQRRYCVR